MNQMTRWRAETSGQLYPVKYYLQQITQKKFARALYFLKIFRKALPAESNFPARYYKDRINNKVLLIPY